MELSELDITREQNSRPFHLEYSINRSNRTIVHPLEQTPFGDAIQAQIAREHGTSTDKNSSRCTSFLGVKGEPNYRVEHMVRHTQSGMAIIAKDNLKVDKPLKLKTSRAELSQRTKDHSTKKRRGETKRAM